MLRDAAKTHVCESAHTHTHTYSTREYFPRGDVRGQPWKHWGRVGGSRLISGNLSRILFLTFFYSIHFRTNRMVADFTCFLVSFVT